VRLHDLRHTVGTYAGQSGANGVEIIDENGGGPGVRLRKRPQRPTK
jgi:hypothetical protein